MKEMARFLLFFALVSIGSPGLSFLLGNTNETKTVGYNGVFVQGNYAYCVSRGTGMDIIEITDPANPIKKGSYNALSNANALFVSSNHAYISDGPSGLKIIDTSNPSSPSFEGAYDPSTEDSESVLDVFISGNYAYLADWYHGLQIVDISNPASPSPVGSYDTPGQAISLNVSGNYAYIADGYDGLQILNIQNPSTPTLEGVFSIPGFVSDVVVQNNYAYMINSNLSTYFFNIVDVTHPASPILIENCVMPGIAKDIYISGNYAYVACGSQGLQVISISQPSSPVITKSYATNGDASRVFVKGHYAYIADESQGLIILDIADPSLPIISLNRTRLNFGANKSGLITNPQTFFINNSGGGTLNWLITDDVDWLNYSSGSGRSPEVISVTANPTGLAVGTYHASIAVSDVNAFNSPQYIAVTLKVFDSSAPSMPFGSFDTPLDDSIVESSIPVTGWSLDDIEVVSVKIYREEGNSVIYIGDAQFVEGARPDIETAYPDYPLNYKACWGYMMLTNFLPNGGNGVYKIHAIATDKEGLTTTLGIKTITVANATASKPFGAIDFPASGGTASGNKYRNHGWVLTPPLNKIPENGSTIKVYVDGKYLGHPVYNLYRPDIASLFPGYANANGAGGYFDFDTTAYENGVHTIYWTVTDNAGNSDGIGSRYFTIQNAGATAGCISQSAAYVKAPFDIDLSVIPVDYSEPVQISKGFTENPEAPETYPDDNGIIEIEIKELERIEIHLTETNGDGTLFNYIGYLVVNDQTRPLPIGSTFDSHRGIFYWQPGVGFYGDYEIVFIKQTNTGRNAVKIKVRILPK
ncbi:MAG TPA: hypothetical protein VK186_18930 [Candidatus Deferrimicrobium sp.]|nr:hypothetical protein [Candidatus Deferrimicrobium sp.]